MRAKSTLLTAGCSSVVLETGHPLEFLRYSTGNSDVERNAIVVAFDSGVSELGSACRGYESVLSRLRECPVAATRVS